MNPAYQELAFAVFSMMAISCTPFERAMEKAESDLADAYSKQQIEAAKAILDKKTRAWGIQG